MKNYKRVSPSNSSFAGSNCQQLSIPAQYVPPLVSKESRYSKKLDIVLLELQEVKELSVPASEKKKEI